MDTFWGELCFRVAYSDECKVIGNPTRRTRTSQWIKTSVHLHHHFWDMIWKLYGEVLKVRGTVTETTPSLRVTMLAITKK